jgi:hypothetical protein
MADLPGAICIYTTRCAHLGKEVSSIRARHRRLAREVLARKVIAVASPAEDRSVDFDCRTLE